MESVNRLLGEHGLQEDSAETRKEFERQGRSSSASTSLFAYRLSLDARRRQGSAVV